jgi:ribonuclease J
VPLWQRVKVKDARAVERVESVKPCRLFEEHLTADPASYVAQLGLSVAPAFERAQCLEGARAVWSLWPGYLQEPSGRKLTAFPRRAGVEMSVEHSSGHASVPDLQRLTVAIAPGRIVPSHSLGGHRFADYFADVTPEPDGTWWEV